MNKDTKILSSHSIDGDLKEYYLDPTVLTAIEKGFEKLKHLAKTENLNS